MLTARVAALAVALSSCSVTRSDQIEALGTQSTEALCTAHVMASGLDLLAIEAELGARGALQCQTAYGTTSYVGKSTEATVGQRLYLRSEANLSAPDDRNCSDFASAAEAQRFFLAHGGPQSDPYRLDGDGDGNACEWERTLRLSVTQYKPRPVAIRRDSAPICHTGPRGGRYYYNSSGNKVYDC